MELILFWRHFLIPNTNKTKKNASITSSTYHLFNRKQSVYVKNVTPPIVWAIFMIRRWRFENGIVMEIFHNDFDETQYKHIRCGQSNKAISNQAKEMENARSDFTNTLWQWIQIALVIIAEVNVWNEKTAKRNNQINFICIVKTSESNWIYLMKKKVSTLNVPFEMVWNQNSFSTTLRSSMLSAYLKTMIHVWPWHKRKRNETDSYDSNENWDGII